MGKQVQVEYIDRNMLSAQSEFMLKDLWGCQAPEGQHPTGHCERPLLPRAQLPFCSAHLSFSPAQI